MIKQETTITTQDGKTAIIVFYEQDTGKLLLQQMDVDEHKHRRNQICIDTSQLYRDDILAIGGAIECAIQSMCEEDDEEEPEFE